MSHHNQDFLVVFSDINGIFELNEDIECKFYIQSDLDIGNDKIGLYRSDSTNYENPLIVKDVGFSTPDEFSERTLSFNSEELTRLSLNTDNVYQFNYLRFDGNTQQYSIRGHSTVFRFVKPDYPSIVQDLELGSSPTPTAPIRDVQGTLNSQLNGDRIQRQTSVKTLYRDRENVQDENLDNFQVQIIELNSKLTEKELEIIRLKMDSDYKLKNKDQEISRLKQCVEEYETTIGSYETLIQQKDTGSTHHLEQQLKKIQEKSAFFERKCTELETEVDRLNTELAISQSELEQFKTNKHHGENQMQTALTNERMENNVSLLRERLLDSEKSLKKQKDEFDLAKIRMDVETDHLKKIVQELTKKLETKEELCVDLKAQLKAQAFLGIDCGRESPDDIDQATNELGNLSTDSNDEIQVFESEMCEEVLTFCLSLSTDVMKRCSDIKSMSATIVIELDVKFGRKWHCFAGTAFEHSVLIHEQGTYLSFAINEHRIVLYKTEETLQPRDILLLANDSSNVEVILRSENVDGMIKNYIVNLLKRTNTEYDNYSDLSSHLTQVLNTRLSTTYGTNWLVICGQDNGFNSINDPGHRQIRLLELKKEMLKVIIIQFDDRMAVPTPRSSIKSTKI